MARFKSASEERRVGSSDRNEDPLFQTTDARSESSTVSNGSKSYKRRSAAESNTSTFLVS